MSTWQLQEAKARFSELIQTAQTEGPQIITRRGINTAVIVPMSEWERVAALRSTSTPSDPQLPKIQLTNAEFLKLLQSAPDFEIPDRHAERLKKQRKRLA